MEESTLKHLLNIQIDMIRDKELQDLVRLVISKLPEAFWKRESSLKYHPVDERGINGNLSHTLKVTKLADKILDTMEVTQRIKDLTKSRAILHDSLRHGLNGDGRWSAKDHPYLVRKFIVTECGINTPLVDELCSGIETHMGKWGQPPFIPSIDLNTVLHLADAIATQPDIEVKL